MLILNKLGFEYFVQYMRARFAECALSNDLWVAFSYFTQNTSKIEAKWMKFSK